MTDKEYREQKKRLQKYIDKWFTPMGLGWYQVDMNWVRAEKTDSSGTAAEVSTTWQYRNARISWYLPVLAELDDDKLENTVVHEFVHILINPLLKVDEQNDLYTQHEYATECIARAMIWVREAGGRDKK